VNVLFQKLCQLSRAELNAIAVDHIKINSLNTFAMKVGANMSSISNHTSRLKAIINGTATVSKVNNATPTTKSVTAMLGKSMTVAKSSSMSTIQKSSVSASDSSSISVAKASSPTPQATSTSKDTIKKPATQITKTMEKAVMKQTVNPNIGIKKTGALITKNQSKDYFAAIKKGYADQGLKINDEILLQTQNMFGLANNKMINSAQIKETSIKKQTPQLKQVAGPTKVTNQQMKVTNVLSLKPVPSPQNSSIKVTSLASSNVNPSPAAQERIMKIPSSVTLTHVPVKTSKPDSRSASPALARVGNTSNPGSRSNSPKNMPNTNKTGSPTAIVANKKVIAPASVNKGASTAAVDKGKSEYADFKAKMMKDLGQARKKATSTSCIVKSTVTAGKSSAVAGKTSGAAGKTNTAAGKNIGAAVKIGSAVSKNSAVAGKNSAGASNQKPLKQAGAPSTAKKPQPTKSKQNPAEIICIDID